MEGHLAERSGSATAITPDVNMIKDQTETPGPGSLQPVRSALSPEMKRCLERVKAHDGTITRYPGGFWCVDSSELTYGTTTVEALVKRGRLEYCEWKESHGRKFPIKARTVPNKQAHA
jgi:hypothetical protein